MPIRTCDRRQLRVAADLHAASRFEHDDAIGVDHRRQSVRDDQRRVAALARTQRIEDQPFRARVDRRQRIVEHQYRRVFQQRARKREPLALTAGQRHTAFADQRFVMSPATP